LFVKKKIPDSKFQQNLQHKVTEFVNTTSE